MALPHDMIMEIVQYLPFDKLINFNLINRKYNKVIKSTPWKHLRVNNLRYYFAGYKFAKCRITLPRITKRLKRCCNPTKYKILFRTLASCSSVIISKSELADDVIRAVSTVPEIIFDRCDFGYMDGEFVPLLINAKAIDILNCDHFPVTLAPKLPIRKYRLSFLWDGIDNRMLTYLSDVKQLSFSLCHVKNLDGKYLNRTKKIKLKCMDFDCDSLSNLRNANDVRELKLIACNHISYDFASFANLDRLTIDVNRDISNYELKYFRNIREIKLSRCTLITDQGLKYLRNVEKLHISSCVNIKDDNLYFLTNVKDLTLEKLDNLTDTGLHYLRNIPKLKLVECHAITNEGIRCVRSPQLKIFRCKLITPRGIRAQPNARYKPYDLLMENIIFNELVDFSEIFKKCEIYILYFIRILLTLFAMLVGEEVV